MKNTTILFLLFFFSVYSAMSQCEKKICKAAAKGNFNKVERIVKRIVKRIPEAKEETDGVPTYITMDKNIEELTSWFKNLACVEDAFEDKCQIKISIYPGWSIIGVRFMTNTGIEEKCFSIQKGTTGAIKIFTWKPTISRMKSKLVYKKMYDCPGFIVEQKKNCMPQK